MDAGIIRFSLKLMHQTFYSNVVKASTIKTKACKFDAKATDPETKAYKNSRTVHLTA